MNTTTSALPPPSHRETRSNHTHTTPSRREAQKERQHRVGCMHSSSIIHTDRPLPHKHERQIHAEKTLRSLYWVGTVPIPGSSPAQLCPGVSLTSSHLAAPQSKMHPHAFIRLLCITKHKLKKPKKKSSETSPLICRGTKPQTVSISLHLISWYMAKPDPNRRLGIKVRQATINTNPQSQAIPHFFSLEYLAHVRLITRLTGTPHLHGSFWDPPSPPHPL